MSRYTDADEALRMMRNSQQDNPCESPYKGIWHTAHESCISCVDAVPTADVVEVVRCKDCKYYEIHKPTITLNCEREGKLIPMMPNDYCSYGERSANGT